MTANAEREFSRAGIQTLMEISRAMYMNSPLIRRSVDITTFYTWAQGANFHAKDDRIAKEIVQPTMENRFNKEELYGHQARLLTHVDKIVDGNLFFALFTNERGDVQIRNIPPEEITDIHTKDGDYRFVTYYRRVWTESNLQPDGTKSEVQHEELYPDWKYTPKYKPTNIGGIPVNWDAPVIFKKSGGLKRMQFGVPETYAAMDWARAYKKFLEDWHTIVSSLARFSWKIATKGEKKIKRTKEKLRSSVEEGPEFQEHNPAPGVGGLAITGENEDILPIPKTGATTSANDAKPSRLMIASAMNIPDTILSQDVDVGNFATSKTMDRPTELFMLSEQKGWDEFHSDIFLYIHDAKVRRGVLPGGVYYDAMSDLMMVRPRRDPKVEVLFPPILEHDMKSVVESVVMAATLNGQQPIGSVPAEQVSKLLMSAIGVEDVDQALSEVDFSNLEPQEEEELNQTVDAINKLAEAIKRSR
jgi:hypothetical protein